MPLPTSTMARVEMNYLVRDGDHCIEGGLLFNMILFFTDYRG